MFFEAQPRFNRSKPGGYFRSLSLFVNLLLNNKKSGQTAKITARFAPVEPRFDFKCYLKMIYTYNVRVHRSFLDLAQNLVEKTRFSKVSKIHISKNLITRPLFFYM